MTLFYLFINLFGSTIWSTLTFICSCLEIGNFKMNEGLDNYYRALDDEDRNWLVKEEENCRENLHFNTLTLETLKQLKNSRSGDK